MKMNCKFTISLFVIAAGLALPPFSLNAQEEQPPALYLRIDGQTVTGSGELRVTAQEDLSSNDLVMVSEKRRIELRGSSALDGVAGLMRLAKDGVRPALLLRYEQRVEPDRQRLVFTLQPEGKPEAPLLVHLDIGGPEPVRQEILPGLIMAQLDEPNPVPDVIGAAAQRTWLTVEVSGGDKDLLLEGGQTATISYHGAAYELHIYRSLRRDPGTNPRLPFEGEKYLLSATLTPR